MESYRFLLDLALILLSTKLFGLATKRFKMPQVVGALAAGLILGPAMLNILQETDFISKLSEIGVIVLMFTAGLETDIRELKRTGKASFVIALIGVIVPLAGGFFLAQSFHLASGDTPAYLQNLFIGVILTATSVSITVETLKEMGKLSTRAGSAILGAAIIDDILGIIALTVITSLADTTVNIWIVLLKILLFFVVACGGGFLFFLFFKKFQQHYNKNLRRFVILAFVFCLLLSYSAERFFGVADITGAFIAGILISNTQRASYVAARFETVSYVLLSPVFFASIGIKVELPHMTSTIIVFSVLLVIVAVLTKVVGCGLGAKLCRFTNPEALRIGTGMVSRGEVALIVATKGSSLGLISTVLFGPVIIMVVITTIAAPILLKLAFRDKKGNGSQKPRAGAPEVPSEALARNYEESVGDLEPETEG